MTNPKGENGPVALIDITGRIKPSIEFIPMSVRFKDIKAGQKISTKLTAVIDSRLIKIGMIPDLSCSNKYVVVTPIDIKSISIPDQLTKISKIKFTYRIEISSNAPLGVIMGHIGYNTSNANNRKIGVKSQLAYSYFHSC